MQEPRHRAPVHHALSIDVEDYFQVSAFENQVARSAWNQYPARVEANTLRLLELLEEAEVKATFFVLGWVAQRYSGLVKRIVEAGHELGSHGFHHQRLNQLSREAFREDVRSARQLLQDLSGAPVSGYRAPSFSFDETRPWIQDELLEAGHSYSSSINPVAHDFYGYANAPRTPFQWPNGLLEIPVTTCERLGRRLPCGGGGYFRLYPYAVFRHLFTTAGHQLQSPGVFYLHPWEIDAHQPRLPGAPLKSRLRHYLNLNRTEPRLRQLLRDFDWAPLEDLAKNNRHHSIWFAEPEHA